MVVIFPLQTGALFPTVYCTTSKKNHCIYAQMHLGKEV